MEWIKFTFGFVIMFGCGLGLYFFGIWAEKQQKPLGFWANGKPLDPKTVRDIPGYNRAYGKLFRNFSVPCMISGFVLLLDAMISLVILILWGTFGIWWLIRCYRKIEKHYIL